MVGKTDPSPLPAGWAQKEGDRYLDHLRLGLDLSMVRMVLYLDVLRVRLDLEEMLPLLLTLLFPLWVKLAKMLFLG